MRTHSEGRVTVVQLSTRQVGEAAGDLISDLRAWAASSSLSSRDWFDQDLAMAVDNASFNERIAVRVALDGGIRRGLVITRGSVRDGEPATFVWWLAVDSDDRRRGIGRLLMKSVEQASKCRLLEARVDHTDSTAVAFWTSMGWQSEQVGDGLVWVKRTEVAR
jgi:ribosomal protein S18 acetylase RimI-like enzyme